MIKNRKFDYKNIFSLKNKNVVILGGSGKMGLNFSKTLVSAGARVFLGDIKKEVSKKKLLSHLFFRKFLKNIKKQIKKIIKIYLQL